LSQAPAEEVRQVTRRTIEIAAPGGGYCLSSSNSIHSSVKPENLLAMVETLRECGEYPIG
jgi:uroporphyrinogen decarboxylase